MKQQIVLFILITCTTMHQSAFHQEDRDLPFVGLGEVKEKTLRYHYLLGLDPSTETLLQTMSWLFRNESSLVVGIYKVDDLDPTIPWEQSTNNYDNPKLAFFERKEADRKCLIPADRQKLVKAVSVPVTTIEDITNYLNKKCFFFVNLQDTIDKSGVERKHILQNLYHVPKPVEDRPVKCERISVPKNSREFVRNYLYRSKPVIIENATAHWHSLKKWSNDFLRAKYGNKKVHVKLTPNGEFEGCDYAGKFENFETFKIPDIVRKQLLYPDLVVVRPAVGDMKFSEFMDLVEQKDKSMNLSAYLEYSSIRQYFPELEFDIEEMPFVSDVLKLSHLNIWLSNGNTLGKLHFDPFDNFLCQLRGNKRLTLFEPHNNYNLYEAHLQEAMLGFERKTGEFRNRELMDSTSMVMSPIDILKPDFDRFPNFTRANAIDCYLNEGDALYLPAFWWHEVQSYPNLVEKRNLAVNFWYKPFLTKSFPCPECKLDVNPPYRKLLEKFT